MRKKKGKWETQGNQFGDHMIQSRDDCDLGHDGSSEGFRKWSYSGNILKVELTIFLHVLIEKREKNERDKRYLQGFRLEQSK